MSRCLRLEENLCQQGWLPTACRFVIPFTTCFFSRSIIMTGYRIHQWLVAPPTVQHLKSRTVEIRIPLVQSTKFAYLTPDLVTELGGHGLHSMNWEVTPKYQRQLPRGVGPKYQRQLG